jgi:hypothetical protein
MQIRGLCSERDQLLACDRVFFELDLDQFFLRASPQRLRSWYTTARQLYKDSLLRSQTQAKLGVRDLHHYFRPRPPAGDS